MNRGDPITTYDTWEQNSSTRSWISIKIDRKATVDGNQKSGDQLDSCGLI